MFVESIIDYIMFVLGDRFKTYIATKPTIVTMAPAKETKIQPRITDVGSITKSLARMSPPSKKIEVRLVAMLICWKTDGSRVMNIWPAVN